MNKKKRVIFMGSPAITVPYLKTLLSYKDINIVAIYTQPARAKGRGMILRKTPVQSFAEKLNLTVLTPENLNSTEEINRFKSLNMDLTIVMGYGKLIPQEFLLASSLGCINVHLSLLPRWRGASPIEHAILTGDNETGVTIFRITEKLDAGPIIIQKKCPITKSMTKKQLQDKLNNIGTNLLIRILPSYIGGRLLSKKQNDKIATYAKRIQSSDTKLNFLKTANEVSNKIRAFSPKPGAWFNLNHERIKIISCKISSQKGKASTIISKNLLIGCRDLSIEPIIVQREGKKPMCIKDFLRGFSINFGDRIN